MATVEMLAYWDEIADSLPEGCQSRFARLIRRAEEHAAVVRPNTESRVAFNRAFLRWLCLKIEEQCADIEALIVALPAEQRFIFKRGLRRGAHAALIPACAKEPERELFLGDLQIVTELIDK